MRRVGEFGRRNVLVVSCVVANGFLVHCAVLQIESIRNRVSASVPSAVTLLTRTPSTCTDRNLLVLISFILLQCRILVTTMEARVFKKVLPM
jgi:hypothetical protein